MDASQINFEEPPALRWQSVINEAEKQNTMTKLVPVLLARYPENAQLKSACAPFGAAEPVRAAPQVAPVVIPPGAVLVKKYEKGEAEAARPTAVAPTESPLPEATPAPLPSQVAQDGETKPVNGSDLLSLSPDELIATVISLRMAAAEGHQRLTRLEDWRRRLSVMNSADLATMKDVDE